MKTPKRGTKTTPAAKKKVPAKTPVKKVAKSRRHEALGPNQVAAKKTAAKAVPKKASAKKAVKKAAKGSVKAVKSAVKKAVSAVRGKVSSVVANFKKKSAAKEAKAVEVKAAKTAAAAKKAKAKPVEKSAPAKISAKTTTKTTVVKTATKAVAISTTLKPAAKSKRPKAFAPADVARGFGFPADAPELPETYGEDRLVLMSKDPEYLFAYWEITPERHAAGEKAKQSGQEYREALRLNWAARDLFDANYALMPVSLGARKWYLRVPYSGIAYSIEIGWLGSQGHFISLLTSNPSDAPESWAATRRRLKSAAAAGSVLSRTLRTGRPQGSSEQVHSETLPAPVSGDWNFGGPGSLASSFGKNSRAAKPGPSVKPGVRRGRG